jgi:uncharacterized membrane protein
MTATDQPTAEKTMRIGYMTVSSPDDHQDERLMHAGCERVFTDVHGSRRGLQEALTAIGAGDTLVVEALATLGRSPQHFLDVLALLQDKQCGLVSLAEPIDITAHDGTLAIQNRKAAALSRDVLPMPTGATSAERPHHRRHQIRYGVLACVVLLLLYSLCFSLPSFDTATGRVTHVTEKSHDAVSATVDELVTVLITSGNMNGQERTMEYRYSTVLHNNEAAVGENVLLGYDARTQQWSMNGADRRGLTFWLIFIFCALILLIARRQGLMALIGMLVSVLVILIWVVPSVLRGNDPFVSASLAALVIIPVTYVLAHGWKRKTLVAIIATLVTLVMTMALAALFTHLMHIPDALSDEDLRGYYTNQGQFVNIQSFYLAALVIGALAMLNDITISQASIVTSLVQSNPRLSFVQVVTHAMNVGNDHIASLTNTLLLVYIGAALPQFLTFVENSYDVSNPLLSVEIVRILVPSIGIVAAVPVSTFIAAYLAIHPRFSPLSRAWSALRSNTRVYLRRFLQR